MLALIVGACATAGPVGFQTPAEAGRYLVQQECAGCHNARPTGRSVMPTAPPLRTFAGETPDSLQRKASFTRGEGHVGMPQIVLTEREAVEIYAFIRTLSDASAEKPAPVLPCIADAMC